ncbi:delta(3,5)-Delta(2,4)-dienoyl-CoA isomerase, mitochondrial-like isoform X1 [Branchiostoma floridae x Branchiostoma belcheri]
MATLGKLLGATRHVVGAAIRVSQVRATFQRGMSGYQFESLAVTRPREHVMQVEMNRPEKRNAMNQAFWREMVECFQAIAAEPDIRAVVVSGAGKIFTAGLDLGDTMSSLFVEGADIARKAIRLGPKIRQYQETFSVIEKCPKPVIAAVHSACVGGGVDLITACDIRLCTQDAWFQIKEVDIGLAADVGTLQRLPKVIGNDSLARELAFTSRRFEAEEAKQMGLVSRIYPDREALLDGALELASTIASKSPIAVQGTKVSMVYSRDHPVQEGLDHVALWNSTMLQSEDVVEAVQAGMQKRKPEFSKL